MSGTFLEVARKLRPSVREDFQSAVCAMASRRASRKLLNLFYAALPMRQKQRFHATTCSLFTGNHATLAGGTWGIKFGGKRLLLPLTPEGAWQEWDAAVAALGHDPEVKLTYQSLLGSRWRPQIFFDVGANYGLHSVLLLRHGVRAVSFEPNARCHQYMRRVCALNGLTPDIQPLALSDQEGWTELWFPERQTWLGTIVPHVRDRLRSEPGLTSVRVRQTTIDSFVAASGLRPQLVKIDTEENEISVLRGASQTLRQCRPIVIFEARASPGRGDLWSLFEAEDYRILNLPWLAGTSARPIDRGSFCESRANNFLARPKEEIPK
jgi:FkbM family methyltransferase